MINTEDDVNNEETELMVTNGGEDDEVLDEASLITTPLGDPVVDEDFDMLVENSPLRCIGVDQNDSQSFLVYQSPNGSRFWCPDVKPDKKPIVGMIYNSWDECYRMYETYEQLSGFGIRISGCKKWKGEITHKVLVCNKWGKPKNKKYDYLNPYSMVPARGSMFKVTDCKALIRLKAVKGSSKYMLYDFFENHNHSLVSTDNMDLTCHGRHLNFEDIYFVHTMSLNKVTAIVAHHLQSSLKGGHHNMRATRNAFKNVSRDIWMFIVIATFNCLFQEDSYVCCLMKTTSRCESSNAMFKVNSSYANTLVQLLMCFDTSINNQRYNQRLVEFQSNTTTPGFCTGLDIEVHASKIYTRFGFKDVQEEIMKGMMGCFISNVDIVDQPKVYTISHMNKKMEFVNQFKVEEIPDRYVTNRWRLEVFPCRVYGISSRLAIENNAKSILRNETMHCVSECVQQLTGQLEGLSTFVDRKKDLKEGIFNDYLTTFNPRKHSNAIEELVGQVDKNCTLLTPPVGIRNKDCGTSRRLVGPGERADEKSKKNLRLCRTCNQLSYHDSRNCKGKEVQGPSV
ncbi:hypothetical protein E3N88_21054 [Mikania micrantha]|uniref:FAR1 domain-containing protein n=1 Tax=Mikania micrantha TaxID=192012 RepID=A0A5N6NIS4_9ASTR|nr:hypothetical protein E3N88_21054 [Mikania micrantha]